MPLLAFYAAVQSRAAVRWNGWKPSSRFIRLHRPYWVRDATRDDVSAPSAARLYAPKAARN
eukprot:1574836-Pleurochrysis_carterae.AAC.1